MKNINKLTLGVMTIVFIGLVSVAFIGCNDDKEKSKYNKDGINTNYYGGQVEGCKQRYDQLFCSDNFKTLNSDANGAIPDIYVDRNGTMIKLGALEAVESNETTYRLMNKRDK